MGLMNALRKLRKVDQKAQITVGSKLPDVDIEVCVSQGLAEAAGVAEDAAKDGAPDRATLSLIEAIGDKRTILLGMPGAFTPTCTDLHLPGFISAEDTLEKSGVEQIALLTTNDVYVNLAWIKSVEECVEKQTKIAVISDGDGDAIKELGLAADMGFGMGARAKRFALLVDKGMVKHVAVDEGMNELSATSAEEVVKVLPKVFPEAAAIAKKEKDQQNAAGLGLAAAALVAAYYYYTTMGAAVVA